MIIIRKLTVGLLVLGSSLIGLETSALAGCNFHGCSQVPGVECNFHGCPNPPNGGPCTFHGCPPATQVQQPQRQVPEQRDYQGGYGHGGPVILYPVNPYGNQPPQRQEAPRQNISDCIDSLVRSRSGDYNTSTTQKYDWAAKVCQNR